MEGEKKKYFRKEEERAVFSEDCRKFRQDECGKILFGFGDIVPSEVTKIATKFERESLISKLPIMRLPT